MQTWDKKMKIWENMRGVWWWGYKQEEGPRMQINGRADKGGFIQVGEGGGASDRWGATTPYLARQNNQRRHHRSLSSSQGIKAAWQTINWTKKKHSLTHPHTPRSLVHPYAGNNNNCRRRNKVWKKNVCPKTCTWTHHGWSREVEMKDG